MNRYIVVIVALYTIYANTMLLRFIKKYRDRLDRLEEVDKFEDLERRMEAYGFKWRR